MVLQGELFSSTFLSPALPGPLFEETTTLASETVRHSIKPEAGKVLPNSLIKIGAECPVPLRLTCIPAESEAVLHAGIVSNGKVAPLQGIRNAQGFVG